MKCLTRKLLSHGRIRTPGCGRDEGIERMVAVTPRHVTGVVPVLGANLIHVQTPYMEVWQEVSLLTRLVAPGVCELQCDNNTEAAQ